MTSGYTLAKRQEDMAIFWTVYRRNIWVLHTQHAGRYVCINAESQEIVIEDTFLDALAKGRDMTVRIPKPQ